MDQCKKNKRKRKKSFLKNARKYAKKGCFGRGSQLDPDTYQYFVRILEAYREGFDTDDNKGNVFIKILVYVLCIKIVKVRKLLL